jgi:alpha-1,6-mannosyltransferase
VKLCALTQSYAPTGGGVRTMLHAQREWCRARGSPHVLIVPGDADSMQRDGCLTTYTVASPLVPGSRVYRLLLRSPHVLRILRTEMPDIIETHCAYNLPWTALYHRRRHGGIVSGVYMTDLPIAYVETPLSVRVGPRAAGSARRMAERYLRALYGRCDVVVAISGTMRERLLEFGVRDVRLVPLGVDLETFAPAARDPSLRASLGCGDTDLMLLYAGRLDSERRADIVLEAHARVRAALPAGRSAALVLVGDGPLRGVLEARGRELGGVHMLPFVQQRQQLATLLASADVYVSAMAHETFGLSIVEAQACGLPVVGVRAGAMVDRVRDGVDGCLVEYVADAASQAERLAGRIIGVPRADWAELGRRARLRVQREFSWAATFESFDALYREALARRS